MEDYSLKDYCFIEIEAASLFSLRLLRNAVAAEQFYLMSSSNTILWNQSMQLYCWNFMSEICLIHLEELQPPGLVLRN